MSHPKSGSLARMEKVREIASFLLLNSKLPAIDVIETIGVEYGVVPNKAREYYDSAKRLNSNQHKFKINPNGNPYQDVEFTEHTEELLELKEKEQLNRIETVGEEESGIWDNPKAMDHEKKLAKLEKEQDDKLIPKKGRAKMGRRAERIF